MASIISAPPAMRQLPFVGRDKELQHILQFYNQAIEGDGISVLWLTGEAGIGKTCLLQQATDQLREIKATPIHICLYPHSATSIVDLLADAIIADPQLSRLLSAPVSRTLSSVLEALHRFARRHPIILILEDLHLLSQSSAEEFSALLQDLLHEPIGMICAARPNIGIGNLYSMMLPYLTNTIELPPLGLDELQDLLIKYKPNSNQQKLAGYLHRATRGNPLIIRAVLPEVLLLAEDSPIGTKAFATSVIGEKAALSIEGLVTIFLERLTPDERAAVHRLTVLGELFSLEAAQTILPNTEELIELLTRLGIITKSLQAMRPLCGTTTSAYPYTFTHSLLYEQLATQATYTESDLISLFASEAALYSINPFTQLGTIEPKITGPEQIISVFNSLVLALDSINWSHTPSRRLLRTIAEQIESFYQKRTVFLSSEQQADLYLEVLGVRLSTSSNRWGRSNDIEEYLRLSSSPKTAKQALHRCEAYYELLFDGKTLSTIEEMFTEAQNLADRYPEIVQTSTFIQLVGQLAVRCTSSISKFQQIRDYLISIFPDTADESMQQIIERARLRLIYPWGLIVETSDELQEFLAFRERIAKETADNIFDARSDFFYIYLHSYSYTGRSIEALRIVHKEIDRLREAPEQDYLMLAQRLKIHLYSVLGFPLEVIEQEVLQIRKDSDGIFGSPSSDSGMPRILGLIVLDCIGHGIRRGNALWGEELVQKLCAGNTEVIDNYRLSLRAIFNNDRSSLRSPLTQGDSRELQYKPIIESVIAEPLAWTDEAKDIIQTILRKEVATHVVLHQIHVVLQLLQIATANWTKLSVVQEFDSLIKSSIDHVLTWCINNDVIGWADPFLHRAKILFPANQFNDWNTRFEQSQLRIQSELSALIRETPSETRAVLSMIDTISVTLPGERAKKIRGTRIRHTLGLMIANQLMHIPLSLSAFYELATGMDNSISRVRIRSYFHTILSRIRELIGNDAIITDGQSPPRLNPEYVLVNLLDAVNALEQCEEDIRKTHLRKVKESANKILDIVGSEPIYPTLYDEFFEAARSDFEVRLRDTLLGATSLLQREGAVEEAEEILQRLFKSMPSDEEIAEELMNVLQILGRSTEAISVRKHINNVLEN